MIWPRNRCPDSRQRQEWLHQLGLLLQAGIDMHQALQLLEQQQAPGQRSYWVRIRAHIEAGHHLASALHEQSVLPAEEVALLASAELTGGLDQQLLHLAQHQQQRRQRQQRVQQAMRYPLTILAGALLISVWLITQLVPSFVTLYASLGAELPAATRWLLQLERHLSDRWPAYLLGAVVIVVGWRWAWQHSRRWRCGLLWLAWQLPGLRTTSRAHWLGRWHGTLGQCLHAGLPFQTALDCAASATADSPLRALHPRLLVAIEQGQPLSAPLAVSTLVPRQDVALIQVGEHTGRLAALLLFIARDHEQRAAQALNHLVGLVEPLLMALIGLLIGSIVLALYLPLFQLGQVL